MTRNSRSITSLASLLACLTPLVATAQPGPPASMEDDGAWSYSTRGGVVYQFEADVEDDATFDVTRANIEVGADYGWDRRNSVGLSFSYTFNGYSFSEGNEPGPFAAEPWDDVHSFSIGTPVRYGLNNEWTAFFLPSLDYAGESGADFSDAVTGSLIGGFAYRVNDRLTIGPGLGIFSELEDSTTVIPILLINWQITDQLSLETGGGQAATQGPGLILNYKHSEEWTFSFGGRYESLRFRLDSDGDNPDGIGEDTAFPLFASVTHRFNEDSSISLVGGVELGGELRIEDAFGNFIAKEDYDTAPFLGFTFGARF